ncbi:13136_t:CDS:2 [Funneliformis caledonium]|uniref:13136_t:CDS:1 n=1 Tax=Funneliformis caledonium TaxID=1117310 RepID=A0A9N9AM68_9GLOM|nr:13136_t:CDS:2 [Funneliformis caledonium]
MPLKSHNVQLAATRENDELSSDELSDNFEKDGIWNNDSLKETVDKISLSVFDIMYQNAKNPTIFNSTYLLTYHGNSDRTQRRKKATAKIASEESTNITKYFINDLTSTSLLNNQINTTVDDLINLDKIIEKEGFNLALEELNTLIKDKSLLSQVKNWLQLILQYINLRLARYKCMKASQTIAISIRKGKYQACLIRT